MTRALALAAVLIATALAPAALAAAPKTDLVDIEDEVMCVTCRVPLNIAEGAQPDSQRAFIRELIAEGQTKEQIKQALVAQYGIDVLATPQTSGVGLTAYAIPLALGAILVATLVLLAPRWRRRSPAGIGAGDTPADDGLSDTDEARLEADLARYDR
ncbi:MAG: cytochrome c-type biogenesis protein CcmH [Solirubrobacteraceae bacterium]|nr:cytochrome c-type biogenesis protein CcmH [Solirubrobacteraceae bacterium]